MHKIAVGAVVGIAALAVILILRVVSSDVSDSTDFAYHALLSDLAYKDGQYSETFEIPAGDYKFKFIPNGDSPKLLSITLTGESFSFSEDFERDGTLHKSPISEYYTWDYLGQKEFHIAQGQSLDITINPNGNTIGTVSVFIAYE